MKIIHIAQGHKKPILIKGDKPSSDIIDKVVHSQLKVAIAIKLHLPCPVVNERTGYNQERFTSRNIKKAFPTGIPTQFNQLTNEQKRMLYEEGAAQILYDIGKIPILYRSYSTKMAARMEQVLNNPIDISDMPTSVACFKLEQKSNELDALSAERELEAIQYAEEAAFKKYSTFDGAKVIIVYGASHNFKPYCEERGYDHEIIDCWNKSPSRDPWRRMLRSGVFAACTSGFLILMGVGLAVAFCGFATMAVIVANLTIPGCALIAIATLGFAFGMGALIGWLTDSKNALPPHPPIAIATDPSNTNQELSSSARMQKRLTELRMIQMIKEREIRKEKMEAVKLRAHNLEMQEKAGLHKAPLSPIDISLFGLRPGSPRINDESSNVGRSMCNDSYANFLQHWHRS